MNNKILFVSLLTLLIGLLAGYIIWGTKSASDSTLSAQMSNMTSGLEGRSGDDFDKAFIKDMISHHEGAVVMAQMVVNVSKRSELLKLANDIISAQTSEIIQMKAWYKQWYGVDLSTQSDSNTHNTGH
jgi:uncharacterized protein (DUF305 family)